MCELIYLTFGNYYVISLTTMKIKLIQKPVAKEIEPGFGFWN